MRSARRIGFRLLRAVAGEGSAGRAKDAYLTRVSPALASVAYLTSPRGRRSQRHLASLRNRHAGARCFIIGNGPSLGAMDLSRLRDEFTFGLNRGYFLHERIGAPTTFLVAVNRYVIEQFADELLAAGSDTFASWHSRDLLPRNARVTFLRGTPLPGFNEDATKGPLWEGATVTYVALQLAYHMGFREAILIGVDHSFVTKGTPHTLVTSTGTDQDHFDGRYFGRGIRWQLPDLETSEIAYRLAKEHFERDGRRVVDATVGGHLTVFPKAEFDALASNLSSTP
jgi:hypothetical protein